MNLGEKIRYYRKEAGMTQAELAEELQVSFQAVSSWERGQYMPDMEKLSQIATILKVSVSFLMDASEKSFSRWEVRDRIFYEAHMYTFVKTAASIKKLSQTSSALPLARKLHEKQAYKGRGQIPVLYHPLMITCHALALKLEEDDILATALLYGICEECAMLPEEFPVNQNVQKALTLLCFKVCEGETEQQAKKRYYHDISENKLAAIVKVLYRCNNMSTIAMGLTWDRMTEYIDDTENYIIPLLGKIEAENQDYHEAAFFLKCQMLDLLESLKRTVV